MWKTAFVSAVLCVVSYLLPGVLPAQAQVADDSCEFANDGSCDELTGLCPRWTDATDCGHPTTDTGPDPDIDPKDRERRLDLSRTDRRKIRRNLRNLGYDVTTSGSSLDTSRVRRAIRDWQRDTGHEPTGYLTRDTADALLRTVEPVRGPNSCDYAHDGTCDEPDLCERGTDTADCDIRTVPQLFCCDTNTGIRVCPMAVPGMVPGQICQCLGFVGYGIVCR